MGLKGMLKTKWIFFDMGSALIDEDVTPTVIVEDLLEIIDYL